MFSLSLVRLSSLKYMRAAIAGCVIAIISASASLADLYDDYLNSSSRKPFVAFLARSAASGSPGHAFVGVGVELDNGLVFYERFMGLYPKGGIFETIKSAVTPVSGDIRQGLSDISWSTEYRVNVSESQYDNAMGVADRWMENTPNYSLLADGGANCNVFAGEVAKSIGLKVPEGAGKTLPQNFIPMIRTLNE